MAGVRERRSIAHDLHDSAIQPYIGLNASLAALRRQAAPDNPLRTQIEELAAMSALVITDLRHFAGGFNKGGRKPGLLIDAPLRNRCPILFPVRSPHAPARWAATPPSNSGAAPLSCASPYPYEPIPMSLPLPITVMLVEDHKTMLWGLQRLLGDPQTGMRVVA